MDYYNAVLLPPEKVSKNIIKFATENYKEVSNGYCLGEGVFPHITLYQFKAHSVPNLQFDETIKTPTFLEMNIRTGTDIHEGFNWIELIVERDEWLMDMAESVREKLALQEVEILTRIYNPHLTLCRTKLNRLGNIKFPFYIFSDKGDWIFKIGKSDRNGQFYG
ncbi:MAG: hypothetical protein AAF244_03020 [Pseudomonadota bacterium]